jgi:hypothetical protein
MNIHTVLGGDHAFDSTDALRISGAWPRNLSARLVWEISRIKGMPAAILGRIAAPDADSAIKKWIEKFGITENIMRGYVRLKAQAEGISLGRHENTAGMV